MHKFANWHYDKGFTIIETLIVLFFMGVFSSMALFSNSQARRVIALSQEQSRVINILSQAKSFSLQALDRKIDVDCGYGIHIDLAQKKYIMFRDKKNVNQIETESCKYDTNNTANTHNFAYNSDYDSTEALSQYEYSLPVFLEFIDDESAITDVVFTAPNADTVITLKNGTIVSDAAVAIKQSSGNSGPVIIRINAYGQISTQ